MAAVADLPKLGQGTTLTPDKLRMILARISVLRSQGATEETSPELAGMTRVIAALQAQTAARQQQQQQQQQQLANGHGASVAGPSSNVANTASDSLAAFSPEQIATLKCQIAAYKLLARNQPVPASLQAALQSPVAAVEYLRGGFQQQRKPGEIEGAAPQASTSAGTPTSNGAKPRMSQQERQRLLDAEPPIEEVEDPDSLVYPYNAFVSPHSLARMSSKPLLIPSIFPSSIDPGVLLAERDRFVNARVQNRINELSSLPSTLSSEQKLKALIELKSLQLLSKQKALRDDLARAHVQAASLSVPFDRASNRRVRKPSIRDAKVTEQIEKQQRAERDKRAKAKHVGHLEALVHHGQGLQAAHRHHDAKFAKLGKALQKFHVDAEREEQRRVERVSKERLRALRADDEEGYLKLIDTAKDTRITHLLRQTDSFLDDLAKAVLEQQKATAVATGQAFTTAPTDDDHVDESRFGAAPVFEEETKDKVDYYKVAHRVKEDIKEQPSILVGGELKQYQLRGLEWMVSLYNNHVNGILADEMGLGKTIQTISLLTYLIEKKRQNGPFLVIVPLSTMPNWIMEFEKWAPSIRVIAYKGTPNQRKTAAYDIRSGNFQVLLTTYEYIIKDRPLLAKHKWIYMIIDEGHRMKNTQSKLSQTLTTYYSSRYRLILTGTPLQNNLPELWALLNFVLPKIFGSQKSFDEWFNAPFANTGGQDKIELNEEESLLVIRRLHKVLRPFLLRRLKKDVETDLPDKVERIIKCKMSSLQVKLTKQIKEHGMIFTDLGVDAKSKATGIKGLQNQIMQLRKICNHPFCFEQVERSLDPTGTSNALLYRVAGKFEILDRILPKLFATGHRVLMFFQMTTVMTIFEDYLNFRRIDHLRLDGTTKHEDRATLLKAFNDPNSKYPIFILSTRAGGLGLNLQTADTVIIFDSDWNPHQDLQAQDRAHRIGQKKEVRILRLVTERSVEEHVLAGASRKIEMDKKIIQAGKYDNKSTAEEREEYLRALLEAADEEPEDDDDGDEAEQLNEAIARNEQERAIFAQMDRDRRAAEEYAWRQAGNTTKLPERLMQEWELPEVYRIDHKVDIVDDEVFVDGRRRARTAVQYDDGMTEEQWLKTMEEDDDDATSTKKRGRAAKLRAAEMLDPASPGMSSDISGSGRNSRGLYGESGDDDLQSLGGTGAGGKQRRGNKRGRQSQAATPSINGDDDGAAVANNNNKRRRKDLTAHQERMRDVFDKCLDALDDLDNPTHGHQCVGLFNQLPNKRDYADYYLFIQRPISLKEIKKKINNGSYHNLGEFNDDMQLMFTNAMTYNEPGSIVYEDAQLLKAAFDETFEPLATAAD